MFDHSSYDAHEAVHHVYDADSGLRAIIAVHSTARGPSSGGVRLWRYETDALALDDVLRLSLGMSYKSAMADLPLGGGKSVILKPEGTFDRAALFAAFGRAVDKLGGLYIAAEDVGVSPDDIAVMAQHTRHVAGLNEGKAASGDPSPVTADGVFRGMRAAIKHRLGADNFEGITVAVQGVGHVGMHLCAHLHDVGAKLIVTDIHQAPLEEAAERFGAAIIAPDAIYDQPADIFAPCALGRSISPKTIERLKVSIVAGAANNQLSTPDMGRALQERSILFAPDYVINAGGIINIASEVSGTYDSKWVESKLVTLERTVADVFKQADARGEPVNLVTDAMARARIGR